MKLFILTLASLALLCGVAASKSLTLANAQHDKRLLNRQYQTAIVCAASRGSGDFSGCYRAEDNFNTEFLCNANNNVCTVEAK